MFEAEASAANFNPFAFFYFSPAAAALISIFLIWCFWNRWYTAFTAALICWWGLGPAAIGPLRYSYVLYLTSIIVVFRMVYCVFQSGGRFATRLALISPLAKFLFVLLAIIWTKSIAETFLYGFEDYRYDAYYSMGIFVLPGTFVLLLAYPIQHWRVIVHQLFMSALVIGGLYFVFGVAGAVAFEPATLFLSGQSRMTLHNMDTINAVRFAPFLMLGLLYFVLLRPSFFRITLGILGYLFLVLVLVVVGTRQMALTVLLLTACSLLVIGRKVVGVSMLACAVVIGLLTMNSGLMKYTPLMVRVEKANEIGDGRDAIWEHALHYTLEHPVMGGGFRNFGEFNSRVNPATGVETSGRDNAHGIFQDCFTDHGIVVGGLFFVTSLIVGFNGFLIAARRKEPEAKVAGLAPVALWTSLLFSGALYSSWGYYLGLIIYAGLTAGIKGDDLGRKAGAGSRQKLSTEQQPESNSRSKHTRGFGIMRIQ